MKTLYICICFLFCYYCNAHCTVGREKNDECTSVLLIFFFSLGHISSFACELKGFLMVSGSNCHVLRYKIGLSFESGGHRKFTTKFYLLLVLCCTFLLPLFSAGLVYANTHKHTYIDNHT